MDAPLRENNLDAAEVLKASRPSPPLKLIFIFFSIGVVVSMVISSLIYLLLSRQIINISQSVIPTQLAAYQATQSTISINPTNTSNFIKKIDLNYPTVVQLKDQQARIVVTVTDEKGPAIEVKVSATMLTDPSLGHFDKQELITDNNGQVVFVLIPEKTGEVHAAITLENEEKVVQIFFIDSGNNIQATIAPLPANPTDTGISVLTKQEANFRSFDNPDKDILGKLPVNISLMDLGKQIPLPSDNRTTLELVSLDVKVKNDATGNPPMKDNKILAGTDLLDLTPEGKLIMKLSVDTNVTIIKQEQDFTFIQIIGYMAKDFLMPK
jgi:hypothetical protein